MPFIGRRDRAFQLAAHTFGAQRTEQAQGFNAFFKFFTGAEFCRILFHIGSDHRRRVADHFSEIKAVEELSKQRMILFRIFFAGKDPVCHRPAVSAADRLRCIDRIVYSAGGIVPLKAPESEVVIPRNHGQPAVCFVQIVVMDHTAGIAVTVHREIVDDKVPQHLADVQHFFQIRLLGELFERRDQPGFVLVSHRCFGTVKNGGVTVGILVNIAQFDVVTAHAAARESARAAARSPPAGGTVAVSWSIRAIRATGIFVRFGREGAFRVPGHGKSERIRYFRATWCKLARFRSAAAAEWGAARHTGESA